LAKNFKIIDAVICKNHSYSGRQYLSENGLPLEGWVERETRTHLIRIICSNGYYSNGYKYPKNPNPPQNKLLSWDNLRLCGGYVVPDESLQIERRVFNKEKPVGDLQFRPGVTGESILVRKCLEENFEVVQYQWPHAENAPRSVMFGSKDSLESLFDIDAISRYYAATTGFGKEIGLELQRVRGSSPIQVLQSYSWGSPASKVDLVKTGLCLGYALESTVSLINGANI